MHDMKRILRRVATIRDSRRGHVVATASIARVFGRHSAAFQHAVGQALPSSELLLNAVAFALGILVLQKVGVTINNNYLIGAITIFYQYVETSWYGHGHIVPPITDLLEHFQTKPLSLFTDHIAQIGRVTGLPSQPLTGMRCSACVQAVGQSLTDSGRRTVANYATHVLDDISKLILRHPTTASKTRSHNAPKTAGVAPAVHSRASHPQGGSTQEAKPMEHNSTANTTQTQPPAAPAPRRPASPRKPKHHAPAEAPAYPDRHLVIRREGPDGCTTVAIPWGLAPAID